MMYFANPNMLFLLLLVPLFFIMQVVVQKLRKRRIRKFGDEALVKQLMPSYSTAKQWWKVSLFSIGFIFLVLALARPQTGSKLKEYKTEGAEIIIALDVSNSMLAEDYLPNRLERAKLAISKLVDNLQDDRIGLIVFAGKSFVQLPVTADFVSAKMFLNSIDTESIPVQGTAIGEAITRASLNFSDQSEKSRAISVITDGENHEDDPVEAARMAVERNARVFTIGVGSPEGKPIPINGELLKDRNGDIVVTRLAEDVLQDIAIAGKGAYVRATNSEFGLNPIIDQIRDMEDETFVSMAFEEYDEEYICFLAAAFIFFVLEMLISDRRNKRQLF